MRMIYQGPLWTGSTALQRAAAFRHCLGNDLVILDDNRRITRPKVLARFVRGALWRLGYPTDLHRSVERLTAAILEHRPDVVFVDSSQQISRAPIQRWRVMHPAKYVYYTPDNIVARHNRSRWLLSSLSEWDLVFTTKRFNVAGLSAMGVRRPTLIGKAFDPDLHRPIHQDEVGREYERFDAVFLGAYEPIRWQAVKALSSAGISVLVCCADNWPRRGVPANVELRPLAFDRDYVRALHLGKFALGFLRHLNEDQITQRSVEITAAGRPMLAEKTSEHDLHFVDGEEYVGFRDIPHLVDQAKKLLSDPERRLRIGQAGRIRCLNSGYSTIDRALQMLKVIERLS
jgi:spore maturation protein CgeB